MALVDLLAVSLAPIVLVGLFVVPFLRVGIDLADEGYLVYGTWRLLNGQIPIRDFRAYDPGRYFWCALFARILGPGYFSARVANTVAMLLALGLLAATMLSATGAAMVSVLGCALALIWMQPRHKQIENFFLILEIAVLYHLSGDPSTERYAILGACIGLSAFFGLNIFVYFIGTAVLMHFLALGLPGVPDIGASALGVAIGFAPVMFLLISVKGYARDYMRRKVITVIKRGSTNLKLPLPWIWTDSSVGFSGLSRRKRDVLRALFTFMPLVFLLGLSVPLWGDPKHFAPPQRLIFACGCVGLINYCHMLSRADLGHLFMSALPFGIFVATCSFALFGVTVACLTVGLMIWVSVWLVWQQPYHPPGYWKLRGKLKTCQINSDRFLLPSDQVKQLKKYQEIIENNSEPSDPILTVPLLIGMCALFKRRHATYDSFPVYPATSAARLTMIAQVAATKPKVIVTSRAALDGRNDLVFLNNYPEVRDLLTREYNHQDTLGDTDIFLRG